MAPLRLSSRALIGGTLIEVGGELDISTVPQLAAFIDEEHRPEGALVLDLAELTFMDSSGLQLLIEQHQRQRDRGTSLHLASPCPMVTRLLKITHLDQLFRTHSSLDQALAAATPAPDPSRRP